tara:strand:- start:143 stop:1900 length:1758 start_codon:yes stop_codon:yes gene_type:complete
MADSFNDMLSNYEDKSLEELGSSLLSRQQQISEKNAKEAKKSKKVGQALALVGVGQKLFKNAYSKRIKELDKQEMFLLSNNENQAKEIQQLGRIMQYMPDEKWNNLHKGKTADEKVKLYLEEYDGDGLSAKFTPVVDALIKQDRGEEGFAAFKANTDTYEIAKENALHEILQDYFKEDKDGRASYLGFEDELRGLFQSGETDMDRLDLFKKARMLKAYDLTAAEKRLITERKNQYQNRGFFNVVKDGLSQIGLRGQEKGSINVFKNIDNTNLQGGNLNDVLNSLDISGAVIGSVDETMSLYRNTFESITDVARSDSDLIARTKLNLTTFDKNIRKKRIYDSDNKYKMTINRRKWNNYADDIIEDELQLEEWATDIASLSLAFKNDTDFAERVYIGGLQNRNIQVNQTEIDDFRNKIKRSEKFRLDIATAITAQQGFKKGGGMANIIPAEYYAIDTDEKIMETYQYNRNAGVIPVMLGEGIKFENNKYTTDSSWDNMNKKSQQRAFDFKVKEIFTASSIDNKEKIIMFEKLFEDIENPYALNYEEYMETLGPELISSISNTKKNTGLRKGLYNDDNTKKSLMDILF